MQACRGYPQGDALSVAICNVVLSMLANRLQGELGQEVRTVYYLDDLLLVAEHPDALVRADHMVRTFMHDMGLKLNEKKTTYMHVGRGQPSEELMQRYTQVNEFRYLGSYLSNGRPAEGEAAQKQSAILATAYPQYSWDLLGYTPQVSCSVFFVCVCCPMFTGNLGLYAVGCCLAFVALIDPRITCSCIRLWPFFIVLSVSINGLLRSVHAVSGLLMIWIMSCLRGSFCHNSSLSINESEHIWIGPIAGLSVSPYIWIRCRPKEMCLVQGSPAHLSSSPLSLCNGGSDYPWRL